jgi:hypothetical protein
LIQPNKTETAQSPAQDGGQISKAARRKIHKGGNDVEPSRNAGCCKTRYGKLTCLTIPSTLTVAAMDGFIGGSRQMTSSVSQWPTKPQFAMINNPITMEFHVAHVKQDTGSQKNWISPQLVAECQLKTAKGDCGELYQFDGKTVKSTHFVNVTWVGRNQNRTEYFTCFVAPEAAPFNILVGEEYIQQYGCTTFWEKPSDVNTGLILIAGKQTVSYPASGPSQQVS